MSKKIVSMYTEDGELNNQNPELIELITNIATHIAPAFIKNYKHEDSFNGYDAGEIAEESFKIAEAILSKREEWIDS
tara:strand:- start:59 stop:289 length:231 start_codon:yes stop_codon:yes gene_type:complete